MAKGTIVNRIRSVWEVVEIIVEEAILAAEGYFGLKQGSEKKAYVVEHVLKALKALEGKHNILPSWAETFVFKTVEICLGWLIERIFRKLDAEGKVNTHRVAA